MFTTKLTSHWRQHRTWKRAWRTADTLTAQGQCVIAWLEGRHYGTAGHAAPPAPETLPLVPALRRINAAGLVTHMSQPAEAGSPATGRQRAFLAAYGDPQLVADVADFAINAGLLVGTHPALPGTDPYLNIVVTEYRDTAVTDVHVWTARDLDKHAYNLNGTMRHLVDDATHLTIVDPVWGRTGLLWDAVVAAAELGELLIRRGRHPLAPAIEPAHDQQATDQRATDQRATDNADGDEAAG